LSAAGAAPAMTSPPGLSVRVRKVAGQPVIAVRVWLGGGARVEAIPGQALITGRMLAEGTRRRDWRTLAEEIEARGMLLGTWGSFETHGVALDALAGDWETALEWAAEVALEPTFPEDRCRWLTRQAAGELESLGDQPEVRTAWGFLEQLYAPHRRALPLHGTAASLAALTPADCAAFHRPGRRRAIVAVAGEIDEAAVAARVGELFAGAGIAPSPEPEPPAPRGSGEARRTVELPPPHRNGGEVDDDEPAGAPGEADSEEPADAAREARLGDGQAHLYLGHLTVDRRHPDHEALELLAVILGAGSGLAGRIPTAVRERAGLAYTAIAQTVAGAGLDPGRLVTYAATAPATLARAETLMRDELARLLDDGVTDAELEEARGYLLGRDPFSRETARQWADLLAQAEHYGLPFDDPAWRRRRLEAPDRAEVEAAARRHVRPDELVVTVGVPRNGAGTRPE
jgi:zinc protease